MNNQHDDWRTRSDAERDDVASAVMLGMLRAREKRRLQDWQTRDDYARDDVVSEAMSRGLDALEEFQRQGLLPPPPKPTEVR